MPNDAIIPWYFVQVLREQQHEPNSNQNSSSGESSPSIDKTEDVLIKLIRIIANLSINQDIGPLIAANETCVDLLMQVLGKNLTWLNSILICIMANQSVEYDLGLLINQCDLLF